MLQNKTILFVISGMIGMIFLLGNAGGAALVQKTDRTGSPLSPGPCQTCHTSGNFNTSVDAKLLQDNNPVTTYMPGEVYILQVVVNANQNAQQFGFQTVALQGQGNSQAGSFQNPQTGVAVRTVNNRFYPEQQYPSLKDTFRLEWVAPIAGTGDVKFYTAGVATNANGNSGGDGSAFTNMTIQEFGASSVQNSRPDGFEIIAHTAGISIELSVPEVAGQIVIYDLMGNMRSVRPYQGSSQIQIDLTDLNAGAYFLHWRGSTSSWTEKFIVP